MKHILPAILLIQFIPTGLFSQMEDPALKSENKFKEASIHEIFIDTKTLGRSFEGIGALSAGASSRLLYDYPEPQRSDILDYLFKPDFGANLHHLKVEIGGDVNSTDGSEPSHAITRGEFENPKPEYFSRGYEWWLMKEAKKRNPEIILEGLQWGAPGWIGNGNFFSEDNAEFVSSWIKGMEEYHRLTIDYVGIWNEREPDVEYIKLLRKVLDRNGLDQVKIDAGDLWQPQEKWEIADQMIEDAELREAVSVINAHTTAFIKFFTPPNALKLDIPLWDGEAHAYGGDWYAAAEHARFNRAYIYGRITKVISWSLISSYHDYLIVPNSGMMKANTPWSGYYEVQPPLWIIAHTNQFAKPGWIYIDSGCKGYGHGPEFMREGLSVTTLKAPNSDDYSIIVETMDVKEDQTLRFKISPDLSGGDLALWRSSFKEYEFIRMDDIQPVDGEFLMTFVPNSVYTLTTTRGQNKGKASHDIPEWEPFPFPYKTDFEADELHNPGKYFSDQHGTFEVAESPGRNGKSLKQCAIEQGIQWREMNFPHTIIGDVNRKDYSVSVDCFLPDTGSVKLWGRMNSFGRKDPYISYGLEVKHDGNWTFSNHKDILDSGKVKAISGKWHTLGISFDVDEIVLLIDNMKVSIITDSTISSGVIGLGTGWNVAYFDNLKIVEN
jgi:hypothetical protein